MKTLKLLVCTVVMALSACVNIDDSADMTGIDTGAYLTAIKVSDAGGKDVVVRTVIPPLVLDMNKQEQLKNPSDTEILITVKPGTDVTALKLVGTLSSSSEAASISPKMGVLADFSSPRIYTVTSYNKESVVAYSIRIIKEQ